MKVVAFNGSARKGGNTSVLLNTVLEEIKKEGVETELVEMAGENLQGCIACFKCLENKDRRCSVDKDSVNDYIEKMLAADAVILGSPTYFADASANMRALIERAGLVARCNDNMLKRKLGAGVVAVRRAGAYQVFSSLNAFFLISEMIVVGSSYWNIGIGKNAGEVKEDQEGLDTMRDLGINMSWLLKRSRD